MRADVTKILSRSGWAVMACAVAAALIVWHSLVLLPHRAPVPAHASATGATLAGVIEPDGLHLVVSSLQTGGAGGAAGLRVGDEIEDVDGRPVHTIAAFNRDISTGDHTNVDLRIRRGSSMLDIHLPRRGGGTA